ncbi:bifunctional DNA-binding transcriptional regulator/O6-methylguanine-DNA methyltransferase Ada [Cedecea sp. FDAARGOS_727]|uniref:bifunctional DNA-binding transcriptional regulator/O6-methylguanine-DNA methyltransferase Ada n=1 Tax=Cedecea sp. FDAARGOS_727 TaxID=2545798 RepID=UPI00143E94A6|nr:bifunctional DNA-binding transcriptional regulator/O6-methylguanine-DNA methyltransferase Ada [Cedecea sp. FDAARGOS_727]QIX97035.1 bifunctional DNA-binding transcriptional regulator/O6-methylguanine-DNA methyltransferase Ada [Cedecea sp. FDAARGOS_727]
MKQHNDYITQQQRWQAVEARDAGADGEFVFAVKTTGIFCRPSCSARRPLRENTEFFSTPEAAQNAGFRACKRCQPGKLAPELQRVVRIEEACRIIEASVSPLTLDELAGRVAMSSFHFHRLFKSVTGLTPNAWQKAHRARRLREELAQGKEVTRAIYDAGFQSGSAFYHQADSALGMTASQYRRGGESASIQFVVGSCRLGEFLVAESERGICAILLGESPEALIHELEAEFPRSLLTAGDDKFAARVAQVVSFIEAPETEFNLPLDIRGTAFQQQVWQALRAIPPGETVSYRELAARIGRPGAVRAVAGACAANTLAIVIPCHRVIRNDGSLSGYRWGVERKRQLLENEAQRQEE